MSRATRLRATVAVAVTISAFSGAALAEPEVVVVPGGTVTHTIPGTSTPTIGPLDIATPPITVPRTCAGTVFCAGPIYVPPQTVVHVPQVNPVPVTPPVTLTVSTTDIVAVVNPVVTTLVTIPPTTIPVPNPFGGDPIPVDVCPQSCSVPGASVVDGATGYVTVTACVGATCETQTVPVQLGNTSAGQICFTQAAQSVSEGAGGATLYVQRTGGTFNEASVTYSTQNGTAIAPGDYTAQSNRTLLWAHGQGGSQPITVSIVSDSSDEPDENFSVVLTSSSGATLCQPSAATVTILDDDNPPAGSLRFATGSYVVNEDGVSVNIEVQRVGGTYGTATAKVAFANGTANGSDYSVNPGTENITFTGTTTSQFVTVFISNDAADEPNEQFQASLTEVSGAGLGTPSSTTVTILDNDEPPSDGEPDQFTFVDRVGVARSQMIYSNVITITGINVPVDVTVWGGEWSLRTTGICDSTGTWYGEGTSGPQVTNGALVCVRHMSASDFLTSVGTNLIVGNPSKSDIFTSTTRQQIGDECNPGQICP